ncbi:MAG: hypothetical protein GQF41_2790 [Candidatus Rifleibacterium amylolyticum]|nr:MAG: hypothetical protein GQF41_2790 [Candidatus Rifleibacterium amylolyticum]NLF96686.1 pilus assembly protein [Candidatus Riflebacteria bacterium]
MRKQENRGQALVEMALVLPLFIFVIMGIFDFGRVLHCWGTLNYQCVRAARVSTRRINPLLTGNAMIPSAFPTLSETAATFNQFRSPMMTSDNYLDQNVTTFTDGEGNTVTVPVLFSHSGIGSASPTVEISAAYTLDMITPFLGKLVGGENRAGAITIHAYASESKE